MRVLLAFFVTFLLAACAWQPRPDAHAPPFARVPYEPVSREAIVAIAEREWRLFGSRVDDEPDPTNDAGEKPEREQGLWQRVGEYWWLGLDASAPEARWTGKHDENGKVFAPDLDDEFPWSAAFVSYVMRIAGAGKAFPYAPDHAHYIDIAKRERLGQTSGFVVTAERPDSYAPEPGDLLCFGRDEASNLTYDDLPVGHYFPAHCEFVVDVSAPNVIAAIGANDRDAVILRHFASVEGKLAAPPFEGGHWLAILRIEATAPVAPPVPSQGQARRPPESDAAHP